MPQEEKSHVGMAFSQCPICLKEHDEQILLDRRLIKTLPRRTCIGHSPCSECKAKLDEGYIGLVVIKDTPANVVEVNPADVAYTGNTVWIKRTAWPKIMSHPIPPNGFCFIDQEAMDKLEQIAARSKAAETKEDQAP